MTRFCEVKKIPSKHVYVQQRERMSCCGRAYDSCYVSVVRQAGLAFVHCTVGVSCEFWSHVGHSSSACKSGVGGISENVEHGYPKGLSAKCLSYKGMLDQASNVDSTGTQTHDRVIFMGSSSTTSKAMKTR